MTQLLGSIDAVDGLELLATTIVDKHMATVLPNYMLVRRLQRLQSLFTYITGVNPIYMLLKSDPSLEGVPSTWLGICLALFPRDDWLHGQPTCF